MTKQSHSPLNETEINLSTNVLVGEAWGKLTAIEAIVQECVSEVIYNTYSSLFSEREVEVTVSLSDNDYVCELNQKYLAKDKPTNVLSFATNEGKNWPEKIDMSATMPLLLGDIILAYGVVSDEAKAQDKKLEDHVAHMVVHGCLHLLGYDHQDDGEADVMEGLEKKVLFNLGIEDPYSHENIDAKVAK